MVDIQYLETRWIYKLYLQHLITGGAHCTCSKIEGAPEIAAILLSGKEYKHQ